MTPGKVKVKRGLAGLGLFADQEFKRDDFIIEYTGELITDEERNRRGGKYLFEIDEEWTIDGKDRSNIARYINHGCKNNAYAEVDEEERRVFVRAKKKIQPGEEITFHYGKEYFDEYMSNGRCRCASCRS
ncbi:MAG: SET domain-containing protein [Patescibacteria group bacterium]